MVDLWSQHHQYQVQVFCEGQVSLLAVQVLLMLFETSRLQGAAFLSCQ